ncbi:asparagine--tRNA ligase [candidate division WOR-3 bacterium]|nr:asparagine--tRNA ligase [candidate division WOR-3 bacterium]
MDRTFIKDVAKHEGKEIEIRGWLYNKRSSGKIKFLIFRDGTGYLQGVMVKNEIKEDYFSLFEELSLETSVIARGSIHEDKRAIGGYEMSISYLEIVGKSVDYPITKKEHGVSFLMANRHLWIRSKRQAAILRIRAEVVNASRDFLNNNGFTLVDAPIFTPAACEGTTTLFEVDYFGEKAYLSQSGQLYNEATAMALGNVYCFGPAFRAEKSKTRRHMTEFWQVEPEMAYADINDAMNVTEEMLRYIVNRVLENRNNDLEMLERDVSALKRCNKPFNRITYTEAVDIIKESGMDFKWGDDFGTPHEEVIARHFDVPTFVYKYPAAVKAFYMKRDSEDERLALGFDLLAPEGYGEIVGGGQREENYDTLVSRIEEFNLPLDAFKWYLDLRKYGSVPHAGFGLGIERTVRWICKLHHIRETAAFPRTLERIYP